MKYIYTVLIVLTLSFKAFPDDKLTPVEFTRNFAKILKDSTDIDNEIIDSLTIRLKETPDDSARFFHLDNPYKLYLNDPVNLEQIVYQYILGAKESLKEYPIIRYHKIIPTIRHRNYINFYIEKIKDSEIVYDSLNEELVLLYMIDNEYTMASLLNSHLDSLQINRDSLFELSVLNLTDIEPKAEIYDFEWSKLLFCSDYCTGLLFIDDIWDGLTLPKKSEMIFAIPSRDEIIAIDKNDNVAIKNLRDYIYKNISSYSHIISDQIFYFDEDRIKIYTKDTY